MEPPLHADNFLTAEISEQESPSVRLYSRDREMRNLVVVDRGDHFDSVDQRAESGAENNADCRLELHLAFDIGDGVVQFGVEFSDCFHG